MPIRVLLALVVIVAAHGAATAQARPAGHPLVSWRFAAADIDAGARPVLQYRTRGGGPRAAVVVERRAGRRWVLVGRKRAGHGRFRLGAQRMGRRTFRLALVTRRGKVAAQATHVLRVYGQIPLSALFRATPGTATVGGNAYVYSWAASDWSRHTVVFVEHSTCRSVALTAGYIAPPGPDGLASTATMNVIQQSGAHPVTVPTGTVASLQSALQPGPFAITIEDAPGNAYGDGVASCWSSTGATARRARSAATIRSAGARARAHASTVATTHHPFPGYVLRADCKRTDYSCVSSTGYAPSAANAGQWWYDRFWAAGSLNAAGRHNCTTYVAYRLFQNGIRTDPGFAGGGWDASKWASRAGSLKGVTVDQTPAIGAVAQWNDGHVGYIEDYRPGQSIVVSSDSYVADGDHGHTSVYTIPLTSKGMPDNIMHFATPKAESTTVLTADQTKGMSYVHHIVQWDGDAKPQKTAWYVDMTIVPPRTYAVPTRHWIPDVKTYWCLVKQRGAPQPPDVLPSAVLDHQIPDQYGSWATCDTTAGGRGTDGSSGDWSGVGEQAGHHGAPTFSDPHTASGAGPAVAPGAYVQVACKILDGNIASSNPDGYWYQVIGDPWNGRYWAPANTFMNGDPWNGPYTHDTDTSVPDCGKGNPAPSGTSPTAVGTWVEQQGHHGASTFSDPHAASGAGPAVSPGEYVLVSCKLKDPSIASVSPDGYWYRLSDAPWNNQYYAAANTFMNGDPWNGPYSHNTDLNVPDCGTAAPAPAGGGGGGSGSSPAPTYAEQQGHHGVHTFSNYHNASGLGTDIAPGQTVHVSCKVLDGTIASVNPDGYWYRIADGPWNNQYYAPANTFMNGDPWNGPYSHNTDFAVPDCGSAPSGGGTGGAGGGGSGGGGAKTYTEQQGHHGANTFSNYHNASGQGPTVPALSSVEVSCKVLDGTIASVNPDGYWYRIASPPWNNQYYAAANTFMNGDPPNGPYTHNTDFAVPNC